MQYERTPEANAEHAWFYEYHEYNYRQIWEALNKIDRARQKLIDAQNGLVVLLRNLNNPYTERRFQEFYAAGGVTAKDWKRNFEKQGERYIEDEPFVSHGQLHSTDPID